MFPNIDLIKYVRCYTFILHGTIDEIVPWSHGIMLYDNADKKYEPWWIDQGKHNDTFSKFA